MSDTPKLGTCCICGGTQNVRSIVMLNRKNVFRGHGWGCVVCNLPLDGASAVLCDRCIDLWQKDAAELKWACAGFPGSEGRVLYTELTELHDHDPGVPH
jgi:hypothetical protein